MTDTRTASRLWQRMTAEQRLCAAYALWRDDEATSDQRQAALLTAQQRKFRPKTSRSISARSCGRIRRRGEHCTEWSDGSQKCDTVVVSVPSCPRLRRHVVSAFTSAQVLTKGETTTMTKEDAIEVEAKVVEPLPNAMFRVVMDTGHKILAHVSGKMP